MSEFWVGFVGNIVVLLIICAIVAWYVSWVLLVTLERVKPWVGITVIVVTMLLGVGIAGGLHEIK